MEGGNTGGNRVKDVCRNYLNYLYNFSINLKLLHNKAYLKKKNKIKIVSD